MSNALGSLLGTSVQTFIEKAREAEVERKRAATKMANKINDDIDLAMEKSNLMSQLAAYDTNLAN